MGVGYQFTDRWAFDYELWYLDGLKTPVRGPRTVYDPGARYWTFVGAAQTFGRFAQKPYPALVSAWSNAPHINLGFAGAGAEYFAKSPELIEIINKSEFCFLQIMSGRSTSTELLKTVGFGGVLEFTSGPLKGQRFLAATAYANLLEHYGADAVRRQVHEARTNWANAYRELLGLIRVPILCVWIEQADEAAAAADIARKGLLGGFPHLITEEEIRVFEEARVEIVKIALGHHPAQLLVDYPTKMPVEIFNAGSFPTRPDWSRRMNTYYPSPEMHEKIARDIVMHLQTNGGRGIPDRSSDPNRGAPLFAMAADAAASPALSKPTRSVLSRAAGKMNRVLRKGMRKLT
jgi:hypothetical protein